MSIMMSGNEVKTHGKLALESLSCKTMQMGDSRSSAVTFARLGLRIVARRVSVHEHRAL